MDHSVVDHSRSWNLTRIRVVLSAQMISNFSIVVYSAVSELHA